MIGTANATLVALCAGLAEHGVEIDDLLERLSVRGVEAVVVEDLCTDPAALERLGQADTRIVAAVCPEGPSQDEIAARTRRAGLDPGVGSLRLDLVGVSGFGEPQGRGQRAEVALVAATARLAASRGSSADAFRVGLPRGEVSRRSLFSLARTSYVPVAAVGLGGCRGSVACGLCADACPADAVSTSGRVPRVEKSRCIGCGACVTACPVGDAVHLPGADLVGFERQLSSLAEEADGSGVLVACRRSPAVPPERLSGAWSAIEVPCLSIVTPGWALSVLAAGARAVAFRGCGAACDAGVPERMTQRVGFARDVLRTMGTADADERIRLILPPDEDGPPGRSPEELGPVDLAATGDGVRLREPDATALALRTGGSATTVRGPGSSLGIVTVRSEGCTMCGLCATVCPSDALRFDEGPIAATLDLDLDRCVACGHCAGICPEHVIEVDRGIDTERSRRGPASVKRTVMARCRRCGGPIAPSAMLERIRAMLPDDPEVVDTIEELCLDCRGR